MFSEKDNTDKIDEEYKEYPHFVKNIINALITCSNPIGFIGSISIFLFDTMFVFFVYKIR